MDATKEYVERTYYEFPQAASTYTLPNNELFSVNYFWLELCKYIISNKGYENFLNENFIYSV